MAKKKELKRSLEAITNWAWYYEDRLHRLEIQSRIKHQGMSYTDAELEVDGGVMPERPENTGDKRTMYDYMVLLRNRCKVLYESTKHQQKNAAGKTPECIRRFIRMVNDELGVYLGSPTGKKIKKDGSYVYQISGQWGHFRDRTDEESVLNVRGYYGGNQMHTFGMITDEFVLPKLEPLEDPSLAVMHWKTKKTVPLMILLDYLKEKAEQLGVVLVDVSWKKSAHNDVQDFFHRRNHLTSLRKQGPIDWEKQHESVKTLNNSGPFLQMDVTIKPI